MKSLLRVAGTVSINISIKAIISQYGANSKAAGAGKLFEHFI
jgi:hypothetical protein